MRARVVTLRFDPVMDAFDDAPLQELLKARDVISIRDHFFVRNEVLYLVVVVTYGLKPPLVDPALPEKAGGRKDSWRALVSEADHPLFDALRDWRAERARREGVPPYVIFTNRQLAAMVKARPGSLSSLRMIEGIGKAKLENYGQELLAMLARIIDHPLPGGRPGKGVPIGNLTSRYFANLFLGELDHFVKDRLRLPGYLRYMDDFAVFGEDKPCLHRTLASIRSLQARRQVFAASLGLG